MIGTRQFRRGGSIAGILIATFALAACETTKPMTNTATIQSDDVWIDSRDTKIPATLTYPRGAKGSVPLAILIHGHGGTRHEAGGYTRVADDLAKLGVASIRMDFPGCGDSRESFANNNLTNMLADIRAAEAFAANRITVDAQRTGLLGFSMGARLAALLAAAESRIQVMALWAPSVTADAAHMVRYVGGPEQWDAMKQEAAARGFAPFTTFWGQEQKLGPRWFSDLETNDALAALKTFEGRLFVLYGDADQVIDPAHMAMLPAHAERAETVEEVVIADAVHGLGLFSDKPEQVDQAVNETVRFLAEGLLQ